jgi:hypothetical protein
MLYKETALGLLERQNQIILILSARLFIPLKITRVSVLSKPEIPNLSAKLSTR